MPGASLLEHAADVIGLGCGLGVMAAGGTAGGDAIDTFDSGLRLDVVEPKDMGLGAGANGSMVAVVALLV